MVAIKVYFEDIEDESDALKLLTQTFPSIAWSVGHSLRNADLVISRSKTRRQSENVIVLGEKETLNELMPRLRKLVLKGDLSIATSAGCEAMENALREEVVKVKALRDGNQLLLQADEYAPDDLVTASFPLACHFIHGPALLSKLPELEKRLSKVTFRALQRKIPSYTPLSAIGAPGAEEGYRKAPQNSEELRTRVEHCKDKLVNLGVNPSKSRLDYSQINMGIFDPGGLHREHLGLKDPDSDLQFWMRFAADFMLRGMSSARRALGKEEFAKESTRVGVKTGNYQGPYLNSSAFIARQTAWQIMINNNDINYFSWLHALRTNGLRTQSNGEGKRRPSAVIGPESTVLMSRSVDGDDLTGKEVISYADFTATEKRSVLEVDSGTIGGRKRIVANNSSYLNDAVMPVPAYIAHYKDDHYKAVYQQDNELMSRFVTNSPEFNAFWKEGFETSSVLRKQLSKFFPNIKNSEDFLSYVNGVGSRIKCGDVVKYDASATWKFVSSFFERLLSEKSLKVTEQMYNSDVIGVYTDHEGIKRFYYISCIEDADFPDWKNKLIRRTNESMSALPSGLAVTAQGGRGPMLAVLLHILERCLVDLGVSSKEAKDMIHEMPEFGSGLIFSIVSAWTSDGGDDHNLSVLILHLLTGAEIGRCEELVDKKIIEYEFLELLPEIPKMNCGYLFHDDDEGRCIGVSLSPGRMFDNNVYPEYAKSFIGVRASMDLYIASAVGTPFEKIMSDTADIIIKDIYGLDGYRELFTLADIEETFLEEDDSDVDPRTRIALMLDVPENDLEYKYTLIELLELGIPEDLVNDFRRPMPEELTRNPLQFFNSDALISNSLSEEMEGWKERFFDYCSTKINKS